MIKIYFNLFSIILPLISFSQGVGINPTGADPNSNAMLDVSSDDKGILIPRLTTAARTTLGTALAVADDGMLVYDKTASTFYYWDGSQWVLVGNGTGDDHDWYEVGTTDAPDDINDDIFTQGKVGIGSTNPTELLELNNGGIQLNQDFGIGFTGETPFNGNSTGDRARLYYDQTLFGAAQDGLVIEKTDINNNDPDGGIAFSMKGADNIRDIAMTIRGTGNVGIGITTPRERLDVIGTIKTGGLVATSGVVHMVGSYSAGNYLNIYGSEYSTGNTIIGFGLKPNSGVAGFNSSAGNTPLNRGLVKISGGFEFLSEAQSLKAVGVAINLTSRFKVRVDGNVGLGQVNPTYGLVVNNSKTTNNGTAYFNAKLNNSGKGVFIDGKTRQASETNTPLFQIDDGLAGGNNTAFWVNTSGNVGINNANPSEKLQINGSIKIVDGTQGAGKVLTSDANGKATWLAASGDADSDPLNELNSSMTLNSSTRTINITDNGGTKSVNLSSLIDTYFFTRSIFTVSAGTQYIINKTWLQIHNDGTNGNIVVTFPATGTGNMGVFYSTNNASSNYTVLNAGNTSQTISVPPHKEISITINSGSGFVNFTGYNLGNGHIKGFLKYR